MMRYLLASLICFFILLPNVVFGETMDNLYERNGLYYKKFTSVPFTGKITDKGEGFIQNGKKNGPWVSYWDEGPIREKSVFDDGKLVGLSQTYYKNGRLQYYINYKNGKRNGRSKWYHKNGQLAHEGNYKDGVIEDGLHIYFHKNGAINIKVHYRNGEWRGPFEMYRKDGSLIKKGEYACCLLSGTRYKHGRWVYYWPDGTPNDKETGLFVDGVKVSD